MSHDRVGEPAKTSRPPVTPYAETEVLLAVLEAFDDGPADFARVDQMLNEMHPYELECLAAAARELHDRATASARRRSQ